MVFLRASSNAWPYLVYREAYVVDMRQGPGTVKSLGLDSVYNISFSFDGSSFFFTRRVILKDSVLPGQAIAPWLEYEHRLESATPLLY